MEADVTLLRRFGGSFKHMTAMMVINALIYSGVFERHPTLTLMIAELGTGWMPFVLHDLDNRVTPTAELFMGPWKYAMKPSEYFTRNVRATPLATGSDAPLERIMEALPEDMARAEPREKISVVPASNR